MEISKFNNTIKVKAKFASFVIDPSDKAIEEIDFALFLTKNSALENIKPQFQGAGEYEIKKIKITGFGKEDKVSYLVKTEGVDILFLDSASFKFKELLKECQVAVIKADETVSVDAISSLNACMIVLWGEKKDEIAGLLGKEPKVASKVVFTKDKLPQELEIYTIN